MNEVNDGRCPIEAVKQILPLEELLCQLAEEGGELEDNDAQLPFDF